MKNNEERLLRGLEAYLQEEIGAHAKTLSLLQDQEAAILSHAPDTIRAGGAAIETEVKHVAQRARRRAALLTELGRHWDIAPGSMTLSSICERFGSASDRLRRQRAELRGIVARVARSARRLNAVARSHQRLMVDVIQRLLGGDELNVARGGTLVDAEA